MAFKKYLSIWHDSIALTMVVMVFSHLSIFNSLVKIDTYSSLFKFHLIIYSSITTFTGHNKHFHYLNVYCFKRIYCMNQVSRYLVLASSDHMHKYRLSFSDYTRSDHPYKASLISSADRHWACRYLSLTRASIFTLKKSNECQSFSPNAGETRDCLEPMWHKMG